MKTKKLLTKAFSAAARKAKKSNFAFSKTGVKTEKEHFKPMYTLMCGRGVVMTSLLCKTLAKLKLTEMAFRAGRKQEIGKKKIKGGQEIDAVLGF